jgi:hypothetical protein
VSPDPQLVEKIRDLVALVHEPTGGRRSVEIATGKVITDIRKSHTSADFVACSECHQDRARHEETLRVFPGG